VHFRSSVLQGALPTLAFTLLLHWTTAVYAPTCCPYFFAAAVHVWALGLAKQGANLSRRVGRTGGVAALVGGKRVPECSCPCCWRARTAAARAPVRREHSRARSSWTCVSCKRVSAASATAGSKCCRCGREHSQAPPTRHCPRRSTAAGRSHEPDRFDLAANS
jgi:hypothetical protein